MSGLLLRGVLQTAGAGSGLGDGAAVGVVGMARCEFAISYLFQNSGARLFYKRYRAQRFFQTWVRFRCGFWAPKMPPDWGAPVPILGTNVKEAKFGSHFGNQIWYPKWEPNLAPKMGTGAPLYGTRFRM